MICATINEHNVVIVKLDKGIGVRTLTGKNCPQCAQFGALCSLLPIRGFGTTKNLPFKLQWQYNWFRAAMLA